MKTVFRSLLALGLSLVAETAAAQHFLVKPTTVAQLLRQAPARTAGQRRGTATTVARPGLTVTYGYDAATRQWIQPESLALLYDGAGHLIQQTRTDSVTTDSLNRTFIAYNAAGQTTEIRDQYYFLGSFDDYSRELLTYDARQQLVEHVQQQPLVPTGWRTQNGERYLNTYDAANGLTAQTVQVYRPATSTYADSVRYLYTLATPGGPWTTRIIQDPDGRGGWRNEERDRDAVWYNFARQQQASVVAQGWTGTTWQTETRLMGTYTATTTETVVQDSSAGGWTNLQRQYASYDPAGNLLDAQFDEWGGTAWTLVAEVRYQYAYNPDQSLHRSIRSTDFFGSGLQLDERVNYANYQNIVLASRPAAPAALALQAYPNPSPDGRFTLQLPAPASAAEVHVTDALGREVVRQAWTNTPRSSCPLDLSTQPAGLFTVRVQTPTGRIVQRISIR